ncbi:2157_t:CDS:1, partial [Scutellospora calospora]
MSTLRTLRSRRCYNNIRSNRERRRNNPYASVAAVDQMEFPPEYREFVEQILFGSP